MKTTHHLATALLSAGLFAVTLNVRADDEIKTYTVPKESPTTAPTEAETAKPMAPDATMPAAGIPISSAPIRWTTPTGWKELAPTSVRLGNFAIAGQNGGKADVGIFSFPGSVGTELENVNRWRNELKLPPIEAGAIVSEPVSVDGLEGKLYDFSGAKAGTVAVSIPRGDATWFFKLRGDKEVVAEAKPAFLDFLKSIHFGAGASSAQSAPMVSGTMPALSAGMATAPTAGEPQWVPPANWTEKTAGPMIFKSFSISGDGNAATVNISVFPGDVGGVFANINRWRGQMGLPPVDQNGLSAVIQPLDTPNGTGTLADFSGTEAKSGKPGRLVAVMMPHGDNTWFYKLSGDEAAVGREKANFLKFVQTVHYP